MTGRVLVFVCWCVASPAVLFAQPTQPPRPPPQPAGPAQANVELALGGRWLLPHGVDSVDAEATTPDGGDFTLFNTESEMAGTPALEARLGFRMSRRMWIAIVGSWGVTSLDTHVTDDSEDVADVTVSGNVTEFTVGGMLLVELGRQPRRGRWVPLLFVGADFLRDVHEDGVVAESGLLFHTGMGVDLHLGSFGTPRPPARPRALKDMALRFEGRVSARSGGAVPDDAIHVTPGVGVLLAVRY